MKDKLLQIRVDEDFLSKLEYLQKVHGFRTVAETVRKLIEKEWRKEAELPSAQLANKSPKVAKEFGELISRQMAIDALDCINGVEEVLRSLPSAHPDLEESYICGETEAEARYHADIVRCKDCRWRNDIGHWLGCPILNGDDDNYCSFAEPYKEGGAV